MAKNKHRKTSFQNTSSRPSAPPTPPVPTGPTPEQLTRIDAAATQACELVESNGPVLAEGVSEPARATLEESLKRVEVLLRDARALFEKARAQESANQASAERLDVQKREQDEALQKTGKLPKGLERWEVDAQRDNLRHELKGGVLQTFIDGDTSNCGDFTSKWMSKKL